MSDLDQPQSFEEILTALESEVQRLERGELPLEEALSAFERGMKLSATASKTLDEAEKKVEILVRKGDGLAAVPFDPAR